MNERERVREKLAEAFWVCEFSLFTTISPELTWETAKAGDREIALQFADQILALPEIEVLDADQSLPVYDVAIEMMPTFFESGYNIAQRDMLKASWVKVVRRVV